MLAKRAIPMIVLVSLFSLGAKDAPFVEPDQIDIKKLLPAPPAPDSDQCKAEIKEILDLQASRTDEDVKRAQSEVKLSPFIYSEVLGSWFNPDDLPTTAAFLKKVATDAGAVKDAAKVIFNRTRPFVLDSRIKPCVKLDVSPSYPSGHSEVAMVLAMTLGEMFPDKKDALLARGRLVGDDRVMAGVHFPSDVEAGRTLAKAVFDQMMKNPDFQDQLEKAKDECLAKEKAKQ